VHMRENQQILVIFGIQQSEKALHQQLIKLPTAAVNYCGWTTLGSM